MARYLLAWELGGDYGHLARLLPLALALRKRGHEVVFVVRDLMGAETLIQPHGFKTYQAPLWLRKLARMPDAISYPELLMRFGYLHAPALTGVCRAWRNLIGLLQPDAVVFDHAPTALLATRGLSLARINFGTGFCIPPASRPMPQFAWWQNEMRPRLLESEHHALSTANQVLQNLGQPALASMGELAECDLTLMCTFAELDHYPRRDPQAYLGPIFSLGQGDDPPWPQADGPRIFAYLKPGHSQLDAMLLALQRSKASVLVHLAGAARQTIERFSQGNLHISTTPLRMDRMAAECDLALCHGGAGTTAALLLAGKPMVLIPSLVEQSMTAHRVAELGAAMVVTPDLALHFPKMLARAMGDKKMKDAAQVFAQAHPAYDQQATIATAADRCESVLPSAGAV